MAEPSSPTVASGHRRRVVAAVLAVASVVGMGAYVLGSTWLAGSDVSPEARVRPEPPPEASPPEAPELPAVTVAIPEGDYRAFCTRLRAEAGLADQALTTPELVALLDRLDFPGLVDAAPPAIRPQVETVRDGVEELVGDLAEAGPAGRIDPADLDADLVDAVALLGQVAVQECPNLLPD